MVETQHGINGMPSVVRYPRGNGYGDAVLQDVFGGAENASRSAYINGEMPARGYALPIGKGRIVKGHTRVEFGYLGLIWAKRLYFNI